MNVQWIIISIKKIFLCSNIFLLQQCKVQTNTLGVKSVQTCWLLLYSMCSLAYNYDFFYAHCWPCHKKRKKWSMWFSGNFPENVPCDFVQNFGLDVQTFQHMVGDCPPDFLEMAVSCCTVRCLLRNSLLSACALWSSWEARSVRCTFRKRLSSVVVEMDGEQN